MLLTETLATETLATYSLGGAFIFHNLIGVKLFSQMPFIFVTVFLTKAIISSLTLGSKR